MGLGVEGGLWGGGSEGLMDTFFNHLINVKVLYKDWIYDFLVWFCTNLALLSLYSVSF